MFYTVYKITNYINNRIYIGAHKTHNIDDGYMGSGTVLKRSQNKHGIKNFSKEILVNCVNDVAMYFVEKIYVDNEFIARKDTYNVKTGGYGGFDYINNHPNKLQWCIKAGKSNGFKAAREKQSSLWKNDIEWSNNIRKRRSIILKEYIKKHGKNPKFTFKGSKHKLSSRKKMSDSQKGSLNSQIDTMWIYSRVDKISKKISKFDNIPDGWKKGRYYDYKTYICKICNIKYNKEHSDINSSRWCSQACKERNNIINQPEYVDIVNDNIESIIEMYKDLKAVRPILKHFDIIRGGSHLYLSNILRVKGYIK